jgi:nucleotide-binding universal stress UspA family protein
MNSNNISKILVPVDFSESSINAITSAIEIAKRQNAEIELVNVIETGKIFGVENMNFANVVSASRSLLESLTNSIVRYNPIKCSYHVIEGVVAEAVSSHAQQNTIDLIVMGTHGASGVRELFIGSNAYALIKKAPCPVLTIPNTGKWLKFNKILFPVRPILNAIDKYDFVSNIIKKNNAELIILGFKNTTDTNDLKTIEQHIENLKTKLVEDEVTATINYYTGDDFISAFWDFQKRLATDLIVITANIDNSFKNLFVGPFTQQIVNHAKVPVLSIKPEYTPIINTPDMMQMAEWAAKYGSSDPFAPVYR